MLNVHLFRTVNDVLDSKLCSVWVQLAPLLKDDKLGHFGEWKGAPLIMMLGNRLTLEVS